MTGPRAVPDNSPTDDFGAGDKASPTNPTKRADDRRAELEHSRVMSENVQMRHKPTGEVTTFNRKALESERLYVPALRDDFPKDQFEEYKERGT
jgi:hypothetical protein